MNWFVFHRPYYGVHYGTSYEQMWINKFFIKTYKLIEIKAMVKLGNSFNRIFHRLNRCFHGSIYFRDSYMRSFFKNLELNF